MKKTCFYLLLMAYFILSQNRTYCQILSDSVLFSSNQLREDADFYFSLINPNLALCRDTLGCELSFSENLLAMDIKAPFIIKLANNHGTITLEGISYA